MDYPITHNNKKSNNENSSTQQEIVQEGSNSCCGGLNNATVGNLTDSESNLLKHYIFLYPNEYKEIYQECVDKYRSIVKYRYEAIRLAKKEALKRLIEIDEVIQIQDGTWCCPICGLHIKDMGAHVKSVHGLTWDVFVKTYEWTGTKIYFSETYRKNLSINKKNFYNNTDAGAIAKQELSKKFSGNNNPACRDDVKLKISKSRMGQHVSSKSKGAVSESTNSGLYSNNAKSYGYTFWTYDGEKEIRFRSKCEYIVYLMFNYYGLAVEHEPYKIEYVDDSVDYVRHYIVDFVFENRLFEVKPKETDFTNDIKYNLVQEQLSKFNKKLEVITPSTFIYALNIEKNVAKPVSFFEKMLIDNIRNGVCRMIFPISHDIGFYANSKFVREIGGIDKIEEGTKIYENKKNSGNR